MNKYLTFFSFLFFFIGIACGLPAGTTLKFPISFVNATVQVYCKQKLASNEIVVVNCTRQKLNLSYEQYFCNKSNYLAIKTNPASNNSCTFIITYWQSITMPEKRIVEKHYTTSTILEPKINKTIVNRTIIQPTKTIVKQVTKTVYVENTTKIEQLQELIKAYKKQLAQERSIKNKYFEIAILFGIFLFVVSVYLVTIVKREEKQIKGETHD